MDVLPPGGAITLVEARPPSGAFAFSTGGGGAESSFITTLFGMKDRIVRYFSNTNNST